MINKDFKSILELLKAFPDEQTCIDHLEQLRWSDGVISPFNENSKVYKCKNNRYRCKETGKYFNVKTGTLFDNTKVELQKWFLAIWLVTSHKKGISSLQLAKDINVTQKTAWFLLQRIKNCFGDDNEEKLNNEVEVDETYVGGKNKNRHSNKKVEGSQGRSSKDKTPVMGMIERGGKLIAKKVKDVKLNTLTKEIIDKVSLDAKLYSDEWLGYKGVSKIYDHSIVKHNKGEYVKGKVHTNTIEGFWSILKRTVIGTHHFISKKHLQKYINEMVFRYNLRDESGSYRFNEMLRMCENRLKYKELIDNGDLEKY